MNEKCPIVRDLLPLYVEELCSDESKQFVETHVAACDPCAKECEAMKQRLTQPAPQSADAAAVLQSMRKTYRSVRVRTLVMAVAVAVFVFLGLAWAFNYVMYGGVPAAAADFDLFSIAQTRDGEVFYAFGSSRYGYNHLSWQPVVDADKNTLTFEVKRSIARRTYSDSPVTTEFLTEGRENNYKYPAHEMGAVVKDGRLYTSYGLGESMIEIKEIYIGSKKDVRLVWKEGDPIRVLDVSPREWWDAYEAGQSKGG